MLRRAAWSLVCRRRMAAPNPGHRDISTNRCARIDPASLARHVTARRRSDPPSPPPRPRRRRVWRHRLVGRRRAGDSRRFRGTGRSGRRNELDPGREPASNGQRRGLKQQMLRELDDAPDRCDRSDGRDSPDGPRGDSHSLPVSSRFVARFQIIDARRAHGAPARDRAQARG